MDGPETYGVGCQKPQLWTAPNNQFIFILCLFVGQLYHYFNSLYHVIDKKNIDSACGI
jgi:hypothetical protein